MASEVKATPSHEYADIFPLAEGPPLWELSDRIEANGLREPIVLLDGKILDGRRRELACIRKGIKPTYRQFGSRKTDGDPLDFVIDTNLHRRHLGEGDRAMAAAKYATAKGGRKPSQVEKVSGAAGNSGPTRADAAATFDVSEQAVDRAKVVVASGTPAVQAAVSDGTVSISDAAKVAKQPPAVQDAAVDAVKNGRARSAAAAVEREPGVEPTATDAEGEDVPEQAVPAFEQAKEMTAVCKQIGALIKTIGELAKGPGGRCINFESIKINLESAKGAVWGNRPTHVCPYCKGKKDKCEACKGEGWVPKHVYVSAPGVNAKSKRAEA